MFTTEQANNSATWFDCVRLKVSERLMLRSFESWAEPLSEEGQVTVACIGYMLYMIYKLLMQFRLHRV